MMNKQTCITQKHLYLCFGLLSFLPGVLLFSNSIWFDEAYTISLIKHDFNNMLQILSTDMHPPLYFITLKLFCGVFGYSIISTKVFSFIGYILTLLLGPTLVKATFSEKTALTYMLSIGAIPMYYYFAVQQRSYSYCVLFITLSFIFAVRLLRSYKIADAVFLAVFGLLASYNHIYSLLACGIIYAVVNLTALIKNRRQFFKVFLADVIIIVGYLPQLATLLLQVKGASSDFWLKSVEPLSVIVFAIGLILCGFALAFNSNFEISFAVIVIMAIQFIGLAVTVCIKPLYIARYSVVILGVFALMIAIIHQSKFKKAFLIILCVLNVFCLTVTCAFEYNPSLPKFVERFNDELNPNDTIVYLDSSFGIGACYFPENTHICTYRREWFDAFKNVKTISPESVSGTVNKPSWLIKNVNTNMPSYITDNYHVEKCDEFRSDFNKFSVYRIIPK